LTTDTLSITSSKISSTVISAKTVITTAFPWSLSRTQILFLHTNKNLVKEFTHTAKYMWTVTVQ
jgi:hypothetical protein